MTIIELPGLIDPHVHLREPGATHKEDWDTGTQSALAGGITTVLAMPNTAPPIVDADALKLTLDAAAEKCRCDYGIYLGATKENVQSGLALTDRVAGMKMYLDDTYGTLEIDWRDLTTLNAHMAAWPKDMPLVCHAEERTTAAAIMTAFVNDRSVHIAHVSRKSEIDIIRAAKEKGIKVTCEVGPHHLFMSEDDFEWLAPGYREVRPRLATKADQEALWQAIADGVVDCIATDHAPHLPSEKDRENPSPGYPQLEVSLALMLRGVQEGRLTLEQLIPLMSTNIRRIFNLPEQPDTVVEVDLDAKWIVKAAEMKSRCGWSPYEGWELKGQVKKVTLRGEVAFENGEVTAPKGFGKNVAELRNK